MEKLAQPKVAVVMIVKATDDEAELLADALASVSGYVDAIYIDLNTPEGVPISKKVRKVADQYTKYVRERVWVDSFVRARQESFDQVPREYDWIMWIDSDDIVDQPKMLRRVIAVQPSAVNGIYANYDYAHDEWGNTTVNHDVVRLCRNNGAYHWKSSLGDEKVSVHETLVAKRPTGQSRNAEFQVIHKSNPERAEQSLIRNTTLLEGMLEAHSKAGTVDPRILFYLATHYFDLQLFDRTKELLVEYLKLSGWDEERCEAHVYIGRILVSEGKLRQARTAFLMATGENNVSPHPYIELGELEYKAKRYDQSIHWLDIALDRPKPSTTMVQRPMENLFRAHLLKAQSLVNQGGPSLELAAKEVSAALMLRPTEPDAKASQELIIELVKERDDLRAATRTAKLMGDYVLPYLDLLPLELRQAPNLVKLRQQHADPHVWPKQSLAIYCPPGPLGNWGPWRLTEGGISGSEEAVIQLSKQMATLGWDVTVFGTPGHREGIYDGVAWRHYWELNPKDEFDVLVGWRSPWMFDTKWKARKSYLWMHDVMDENELTPERIKEVDRVIFMSQYHADFYPTIPTSKVFISGNGIDPAAFKGISYENTARTKFRIVYMSDHVRGLRLLYEMWPKLKSANPEAVLDVYYGWEGFDSVNKDNPERMEWKDRMIRWAESLDGVTDHGRINHDQVVKELADASILAYPCTFPEVYSITYVKAMAAGCLPVSSDYGVLKYYDKGVKVHFDDIPTQVQIDQYQDVLEKNIRRQLTPKDRERLMDYGQTFSWFNTAKGWNRDMR